MATWENYEDFLGEQDNAGFTFDGLGDHQVDTLQRGYQYGSLTDGLVAYYTFDDDANDAIAIDSALGNDATINGPVYTTGQVGQALDFDGVDDGLQMDNVTDVLNTSTGTISFKINSDNLAPTGTGNGDSHYFTYTEQNNSEQIIIVLPADATEVTNISSSHIGMNYESGDSRQVVEFDPVNDTGWSSGEWHTVTCTWDNPDNRIAIYADGVLQDTNSTAGSPSNLDTYIVGENVGGAGNYDGRLDDYRVYNRPLSLPEIQQIAGTPPSIVKRFDDYPKENLVGDYFFDNDITDSSRNGNNLSTPLNSSTFESGYINEGLAVEDFYYAETPTIDMTDALTMAIWVKTTSGTENNPTFASHGDADAGFTAQAHSIGIDSASGVAIATSDDGDGPYDATGTTVVNDGEWHHVAGTFNNSERKLYVDGVLEATNTTADTVSNGNISRVNTVGDGQAEAQTPEADLSYTLNDGTYDNAQFFNEVLSAGEIKDLMLTQQFKIPVGANL